MNVDSEAESTVRVVNTEQLGFLHLKKDDCNKFFITSTKLHPDFSMSARNMCASVWPDQHAKFD